MHKLVLIRHGQSQWNLENRFTGWTDVDLTAHGREEAVQGACLLREAGFTFDIAHTSLLKRAIRTLWLVQDEMDLMWMPVFPTWRLNERHYGALQGLNKAETAAKYGDDQVLHGGGASILRRRNWIWRMSGIPKGSTLRRSFSRRIASGRIVENDHPADHALLVRVCCSSGSGRVESADRGPWEFLARPCQIPR